MAASSTEEDEAKSVPSLGSGQHVDSEKVEGALLLSDHPAPLRDIGAFRIMAAGFNIPNSWISISAAFATAAAAGGTVELIYGCVIACVAYGMAAVGLAELASVYPTAGGQYHFVSILAPKRFSRSLSYMCGMVSTVSWIACAASCCSIVSICFWSLGAFFTGYAPEPWQLFLMFQALNVFAMFYNLFLLKRSNWMHDVVFILSLVGFFVVSITCLAISEKQPSRKVWTQFESSTGWTPFVSFATGLATPGYMYGGLDGALHLAEETLNASVAVPKALMAVIGIGFVTAFTFSVAMSYCIIDLSSLLEDPIPIYKLWREATKSVAAGTVFMVILIVVLVFVLIAVMQTTSRLIWALARDNGLLFSPVFAKLEPRLGNIPANAILLDGFFIFICGCISLGSSAAFNALLGSFLILQFISFAMPAALLIYQKRDPALLPPTRSFKVPEWLGWTCNVGACVAAVFELVFFTFPTGLPATSVTMNWASVVLAIIVVISVVNWILYARKKYQGPRIELRA